MLEKDVKESGVKIKIVEKAGTSRKKMVRRSDPFKRKRCDQGDCIVCQTEGKGPCRATNVTYEIKCNKCNQKYMGETSRNMYSRGKEHLREMDLHNEKSVLWKHAQEKHQEVIPNFTCNITEIFQRDAMLRQIIEAVTINKEKPQNIMNTKSEWNFVNLPPSKFS